MIRLKIRKAPGIDQLAPEYTKYMGQSGGLQYFKK